MTPPPPPHDRDELLWLVADEARVKEINARVPESYAPEAPVTLRATPEATVLSQRLKGY